MSVKRIPMRVARGALTPAGAAAESALRSRNYRVGDLVFIEIRKPRNPRFHRLAHRLGELIAENIDAFAGMDGHEVLKRLQIEANVGCDEIALNFPGLGPCTYRVPQSLSYESMSQEAFRDAIARICAYVSRTYWSSLSPEKIETMADCYVEAA